MNNFGWPCCVRSPAFRRDLSGDPLICRGAHGEGRKIIGYLHASAQQQRRKGKGQEQFQSVGHGHSLS